MRVLCGAAVVAVASAALCGLAQAQTSIRYDFSLEVTSNTVAVTDPGTTFADVPVGALGTLSIEASTTPLAGFGDANTLAYAILSASATIDGIDVALDQSLYPSDSFITGLNLSNDVSSPFIGPNTDAMGAVLASALPDAGLALFSLAAPSLWDSTALPTSIDLAVPGLFDVFSIDAPNRVDADGQLRTGYTGVDITVIPAPASGLAVGALGVLAVTRRR